VIALSYTSAKLYEECPHRFHAEKVRKIRQEPTAALAMGNFVHEVADKYFKHLVKTGQKSDYNRVGEIADELWRGRTSNKDWRILPEASKPDMMELVRGLREGSVIEPAHVVGSEIDLAFDRKWRKVSWFSKQAWWRMKIDRLDLAPDGRATVWDLKTGRKIDQIRGNKQLPNYANGVKLILPEAQEFTIQLFYARTGALKEATISEAEIAEAREWAEAVSERVELSAKRNEWPATPGSPCAYCPIIAECPAYKKQNGDVPQLTDDAEKLVERYIMIDQERKEVLDKLKIFVESNGPVEANGMVANFSKTETLEFEMAELYRTLRASALEPLDYMKADTTALKKLAKKDQDIRARLNKIVKIKASSRFGVTKVKA